MKLKQLFDERPASQHGDICVDGNRVYVRDADGDIIEYRLQPDGELFEIRNDKKQAEKLAKVKADTAAIKEKVGA